jgi:hypothetical protein
MPDGNAGGLVYGQAECVTWHDQQQVVASAGVLVVCWNAGSVVFSIDLHVVINVE